LIEIYRKYVATLIIWLGTVATVSSQIFSERGVVFSSVEMPDRAQRSVVHFNVQKDSSTAGQSVWFITGMPSRFWKHTTKLTVPPSNEWLPAAEFGWQWQTQGRRDWHHAHRMPALGVALLLIQTGETRHGAALAILPHLDLSIVRRPAWSVQFRVATGIGRIAKPYQTFGYTASNALGSRWNNCTQFRLGSRIRLNPYWRMEVGGELTHFSNGSYELPNFGINLPGLYAGAYYSRKSLNFNDIQPRRKVRATTGRRWGGWVQYAESRVEYLVVDGPKRRVKSISGGLSWHVHRFNTLSVGYDWEEHAGVYAWALHNGTFADRAAARAGSQRRAITLADEFWFGSLSIMLQSGIHVGPPIYNQLTIGSWYNRLSVRVYAPPLPHTSVRFYGGIGMKAYKAVAENIALQAGFAF
jgi:hypothetical protein